MKDFIKIYANLVVGTMLLLPHAAFSIPLYPAKHWICNTYDKTHKHWSAKGDYEKVALNKAFDACKKESTVPESCKTSLHDCEGFKEGVSTRPLWQCTALDAAAMPWRSELYPQRDDAALGAKAYCKSKSLLPESCYINLITCTIPEVH